MPLRLDKPAHLFRFCNNFSSPQTLPQPSDFSGFWDAFATFLTNFLGFWDTFASFPRLSGGSAGVLLHLYGISTTTCLQPQHLGCRRPPCKPYESLQETLKSIQRNKKIADICDLGNLFMMIQNDSRLGFSVASFIRQAILERKSWMQRVLCRPCTPPDHWNRNLFQHPPSVAEFPADFERTFTDGKPWFFYEHPLGQ